MSPPNLTTDDRGSEQPQDSPEKVAARSASAAESGAVDAPGRGGAVPGYTGTDPGLALLIEVWPELPDTVKNRILRLTDAVVWAGR